MKRGRPRHDGLDAILPGKKFVREAIRTLVVKQAVRAAKKAKEVRRSLILPIVSDRDLDFIERYKGGETLQSIGNSYGISRERVRQRLSRHGIYRMDGGITIRNFLATPEKVEKLKVAQSAKEAKVRARYGCSVEHFAQIPKKARVAFKRQKHTARNRGIGWELNLWEWWTLWQESGHWHERGRGGTDSYCMSRPGDSGPYSVNNVLICTNSENIKHGYILNTAFDRMRKRLKGKEPKGYTRVRRAKSKPFSAKYANQHLGYFSTAKAAHAAYLQRRMEVIGQ